MAEPVGLLLLVVFIISHLVPGPLPLELAVPGNELGLTRGQRTRPRPNGLEPRTSATAAMSSSGNGSSGRLKSSHEDVKVCKVKYGMVSS